MKWPCGNSSLYCRNDMATRITENWVCARWLNLSAIQFFPFSFFFFFKGGFNLWQNYACLPLFDTLLCDNLIQFKNIRWSVLCLIWQRLNVFINYKFSMVLRHNYNNNLHHLSLFLIKMGSVMAKKLYEIFN